MGVQRGLRAVLTTCLLGLLILAIAITPARADMMDGLVAYYPFNGNANDTSGNGNHGTVNGASLTLDRFGNSNSAYSFDGLNDYIDIGNGVKPPLPITVSLWVKAGSVPPQTAILFRNDKVDGYSVYYGIALYILSTGVVESYVFDGGTAGPNSRREKITDDVMVTDTNWHHLAAVYRTNIDMSIYWDGVERNVHSGDGTGGLLAYSSAAGAIGKGNTEYLLRGCLDEVRVYDRALSDVEIVELIPEPATLSLLALGGLALIGSRRK